MYQWLRLQNHFTCIIACPSSIGKATFRINFLQNFDTLCSVHKFKGGIIWVYSEKVVIHNKELSKSNRVVGYHKGVSTNFDNA